MHSSNTPCVSVTNSTTLDILATHGLAFRLHLFKPTFPVVSPSEVIPRGVQDSSGTRGLGTRILHIDTGPGVAYYLPR